MEVFGSVGKTAMLTPVAALRIASIHMQQLEKHRTDLCEIWYCSVLPTRVCILQRWLESHNGHYMEDRDTFVRVSPATMIVIKFVGEN